jgi:glycosyltransferase involved in cell wall biosynthesis
VTLKFSVITPSYNQGRFIQRTIDSVLSQNAPEMEYVICDGGSKDETVDILKSYGDKIRWVSEPDHGQADAVNKGIAMTSGDIIAWINSDDVYYPGAFATVRAVFETHPEVEILYGDADHIDEFDNIIEPYPIEPWNYKRLLERCYLCQPAVFFRRSLIEKYGPLDAALQYCMDYELWLRYGQKVEFHYLPKRLAGSRLHEDTKTLGQRFAVCTEINDMLKRETGWVPTDWIFCYAHVKMDQQNLDRDDPAQNRKFMNGLIQTILWSFWHWKSGYSARMLAKLGVWWWSVNVPRIREVMSTPFIFKPFRRLGRWFYRKLTAPLYRRLKQELGQDCQNYQNEITRELHRINQAHLELQGQLAQRVADEFIVIYKLVLQGLQNQDTQAKKEILDELTRVRQSLEKLSADHARFKE